jgi:putative colanic acid biosynthesis acetyltransferase WcaF
MVRSGKVIARLPTGRPRAASSTPTDAVTTVDKKGIPLVEKSASSAHDVIPLAKAPGEHAAWDRPRSTIYLWAIAELIFVTNPWQISSSLRNRVLRAFGAEIGSDVVFRPRTRVKFPWKLHIGNDCWIGEGVWFHNQDHVFIGHDAVVSQETFITTGSHAHRRDMGLITRPVMIGDGAWVTSRCVILGGADIGRNALVTPHAVVSGRVDEGTVFGPPPSGPLGKRFG